MTYLKARCQNEECGHHEEYYKLTGGKTTITQEWAERLFRGRKWELGKDREHDTCPVCIQRKKDERAKRQEELLSSTAFTKPDRIPIPPAQPQPARASAQQVQRLAKPENPTEEFVAEFLQPIMQERVDRPGFTRYVPGWTDDRVLLELNKTIPSLDKNALKKMRQKFYGMSRPRTPSTEMPPDRSRVIVGRFGKPETKPQETTKPEAEAKEPEQTLQEFAESVAPAVERRESMVAPAASDDRLEVRMGQVEKFMRALMDRVNELTEDNDKLQDEYQALHKTIEGVTREHATLINRVYDISQEWEKTAAQFENLRRMVKVLENRQPESAPPAEAAQLPEETLRAVEKVVAFQKAMADIVRSFTS